MSEKSVRGRLGGRRRGKMSQKIGRACAAVLSLLLAVAFALGGCARQQVEPPVVSGTYVYDANAPADVLVEIETYGAALLSLKEGGAALESETDYTYTGGVLVLNKTYFTGRESGTLTFTAETEGGEASFTVTVIGKSVQPPDQPPEQQPDEPGEDTEGETTPVKKLFDYTDYNASSASGSYDRDVIYQNDLETIAADPSVIYIEEGEQAGYFYMYITSDKLGAKGYLCYRSKDLVEWEEMGTAFAPASYKEGITNYSSFATSNYWAPEVIYDKQQKLYYLFYSASYIGKGLAFYLDCAVSSKPQGPFVQYSVYVQDMQLPASASQEEKDLLSYWQKELKPYMDVSAAVDLGIFPGIVYIHPPLIDFRNMRSQKEGETDADYLSKAQGDGYLKVIDASPFIDPVTGEKYLYFVRDLGENGENDNVYDTSAVGVIALDEYWRPKLDENGNYESVRLLTENNRKTVGGDYDSSLSEGNVNEGPFMLYNKENKKYYLLYSANSYWEKTYSVRVAVGDSPLGPFTKLTREEGGWLLYADPSCSWMSGTGHNTVAEKDGKQYIVYHAHQNRATGNSIRAVAFDELVWLENANGLLVPHANGPSYAYMPQTAGEWSNIAPEAQVVSTNIAADSDTKYLNDGAVMFHDDGVVQEFELNAGAAEITLTFDSYREVRALFVFNSFHADRAFNRIGSVEFYCFDTAAGSEYIAYTSPLDFNWEKYNPNGTEYIPGGSFAIGFKPMLVNKITIKIPASETAFSISDIMILGK